MVHVPKTEPGGETSEGEVETIVGTTHQIVTMSTNGNEPQVLQVLSLKDAAALTKALSAQQDAEIKPEETITGDP